MSYSQIISSLIKLKRLQTITTTIGRYIQQSVVTYSARLRRAAVNYNFGVCLYLALRAQFIAGTNQRTMTKKLLDEDRTFNEVIKITLAEEVAIKEVEYFTNDTFGVSSGCHCY